MNTSLSVTYDDKQFAKIREFVKVFPKAANEIAKRTAVYGLKLIVTDTPVKTGAARRSWRTKKNAEGQWSIISDRGAGAKYTPMLEVGTGIFGPEGKRITSKSGKMLAFNIIPKGSNTPLLQIKLRNGKIVKGGGKDGTTFFFKSTKGQKAVGMVKNNVNDIKIALNITAKQVFSDIWALRSNN
jgi:hypothetical protein